MLRSSPKEPAPESVEVGVRGHIPPRLDPDPKGRSFRRSRSLALVLVVLAVGSIFAGVTSKFFGPGAQRQSVQTASNQPTARGIAHPTEAVPPGQAAVEFITPQAAGPVNPGYFIDVIATVNTELFSSKNPKTVSRKVFVALRVIRVDRPAPRGHVGILTVAMSPCDAHYAPWFAANAALRFTFVNPVPYDVGTIHTESCGTGDISPAAVDARWHFASSS
jgi:hypothetical protein